jgi:serine/threonine protein kinase/tetratricopeptide (TPR) repeat protein
MKSTLTGSAGLEPDARLLEAIQTYYAVRDRGDAVDSASILEQFPDVLEGLSEFLSGVECVEQLAKDTGRGPSGNGRRADPPPSQVGDYVIEGELGQGGMGVVYRAYLPATERRVALKMMRWGRESTSVQLQRFQIEVRAVATLDHPQIVPIYDVSEFDGRPFFTMKLLEGGALSQCLDDFRDDPMRAADVILGIARALDEAHARGILHRDVKPHNILLDAAGQPYLTDFGLAKFHDRSLDLTGSIATVGSPQYMAPEQARGESRNVTTAADVYGLGATLYALLTGRPPFESDSLFDLLHQIQTVDPVPPTRLNDMVPGDLEVICLKCLSKDRSDRYATAGELAADLQSLLEGLPIRARPPRPLARLRLWCRRNRRLAAVSALLVVVLLAGSATSTYFWHVAESRLAGMTAAKERAEGSYRLSRQALDRSVKLILDDPRLQSGPLEKLRLDVASAQLEFYEQFVTKYGRDPTYASDLAYSHLTMGHLANQFGEQDRALMHFEQGRDLYERLTDDPAGLRQFGKNLATCWNQVACIQYDRQRNRDVEDAYKHAREILERLIDSAPDDDEALLYLAETLKNQANLRRDTGRAEAAVELHRRAVDLARRAVADSPSNWARGTLATALNELGYSCERIIRWNVAGLPHWDAADAAYREAEGLFRRLAEAEPDDVEWLTGLADTHLNLASINGSEHPGTAEAEYRAGLKIWERLVRDHPEVPGYSVRYAESIGYFGDLLQSCGRYDDAAEAYRTAMRLCGEIPSPGADAVTIRRITAYAHYGLGLAQSGTGQLAEAIASLNEASRIYLELAAEIPNMNAVAEMQVLVDEALASVCGQAGQTDAELSWRMRQVTHARRLVELGPADEKYAESLASAIERLGDALMAQGRNAEAEQTFREAQERPQTARSELALRFRDAFRIKEKLVAQFGEQGRNDDAVQACRECVELCRSWVAARPDQRLAKKSLHDALTRLADLLESSGFLEEAGRLRSEAIGLESSGSFRSYGNVTAEFASLRDQMDEAERTRLASRPAQAIEQIDRVLAELSNVENQIDSDRRLRKLAVDAHAGRAMSLTALGRHAEAVGSWERAIAYDPDGRAWMRINRACDLALAGRIEDAAQSVDDAVRQYSDLKPIELRAAAGALAVCAQVVPQDGKQFRDYTQTSLGLLRRAIESGYRNVAELDGDRQLSVIRALPEYASLTAPLREGPVPRNAEPMAGSRPALDAAP